MRKLCLPLVVAGVLLLAGMPLFAGGGSDQATTAGGRATVSMMGNLWARNPNWSPDTYVINEFSKIMGADISLLIGDNQKYKTLVASGDIPDLIFQNQTRAEAMEFGTAGVLFPLDTKFAQMPNLNTWRQKYSAYDAVMTATDGHQYGTPQMTQFERIRFGPVISYKVRELGVDPEKDIQTFDDLYNVLSQFKRNDPSSTPWVSRARLNNYGMFNMFGTDPSIYQNPNTGKYAFGPMEDTYRDMVQFLSRAWAGGLMHPDFFSMGEDPWREALISGQGYFTVDVYGQASWFGGDTEDRSTWWIPMLAPEINGRSYWSTYQEPPVQDSNQWSIGAKSAVVDNALKLIDYLYSDDGVMLIYFGRLGETAEIAPDGYAQHVFPAGTSAEAQGAWVWEQGFHQFRGNLWHTMWEKNPRRAGSVQAADFDREADQFFLDHNSARPPQPVITFNNDELDVVKQLQVDLDTIASEAIVQFVTGIRPMSEWNQFTAELNRAGVDQLVSTYEGAYARYQNLLK